jgi:hypothetical protein
MLDSTTAEFASRGCRTIGEGDTPPAARLLVAALSDRGFECTNLTIEDAEAGPVDFRLRRNGEDLAVQLVRAESRTEVNKDLNKRGKTTGTVTADEASELLRHAIQQKAKHYPIELRATLALVIDASRFPYFALGSIVDTFTDRHWSTLVGSGFTEVWLLAAGSSGTIRLFPREG